MIVLAATLLVGCSGQVVLLQSPDGGPPGGENEGGSWDGSYGGADGSVGYADASPDQWGTNWQPDAGPVDGAWGYDASFDDASVFDGSVYDDGATYYDGGVADGSVDYDACGPWGICTDEASVDASCAQWCCEPPSGGRGYPTVQCVPAGVTCTLPAIDCQYFDAGWWGD